MGISKPSLFSGLPYWILADIMHLVSHSLTDLFLNLWWGTLDCDLGDSVITWDWAVLPGSFDHLPLNPAEKINSGYKAQEFPLAAAIHLHQHAITPAQLHQAHRLIEFV